MTEILCLWRLTGCSMKKTEFGFHVNLLVSVYVTANTESDARTLLEQHLNSSYMTKLPSVDLGDGNSVEMTNGTATDEEPELFEIDGDDP